MKYLNLLPLKGIVQPYDWGGYHYIPDLLDEESPEHLPQAELWMGAHPRGMSVVTLGQETRRLDDWIASDPEGSLGKTTAARFEGQLPFLFKVLDVRKMLSIQAHPTKEAAEAGFQRENEAGIPLSAPDRNYKDNNHKPEIMAALTDFWLLHGFRPEAEIGKVLQQVAEFNSLQDVFAERGVRGLYQYLMELPQNEVDKLLRPMSVRLEKALDQGRLDRSQPDYWAAQAFRDYTIGGHYDRGIFSIYLFNLVYLQPGEGISQAANVPHAYLEGVNVELMANSDNVFRGGLTPKHVDVHELMQHLQFEAVSPHILKGETGLPYEQVYPTPVQDFELSRIELSSGDTFLEKEQFGPAIYILLSGSVATEIGKLKKGAIFFSPDGARVEIKGLEQAVLFRAGVPE